MKRPISNLTVLRYWFHSTVALVLVASLIILLVRPGLTASNSNKEQGRQRHDGEEIFRGLFFGEGDIAQKFPQLWKRPEILEYMKSPERVKQWNAFRERMVVELRKKDRTFFTRFGEETQSGDHLRISAILKESVKLIKEEMQGEQALAKTLPGKAPADRQAGSRQTDFEMDGKTTKVSRFTGRLRHHAQDPTMCDAGICVTPESDGSVSIDYDASDPQGVSAMRCAKYVYCWAAVVIAVVVALVVFAYKVAYIYSPAEQDEAETFFQETLIDSIAWELYVQ